MQRKPYTVQEKAEILKSEAIVKVANSSAAYSKEFNFNDLYKKSMYFNI